MLAHVFESIVLASEANKSYPAAPFETWNGSFENSFSEKIVIF